MCRNNIRFVADIDWMMARWDFEKNTADPKSLTRYSKEKVWWKCLVCGNSSEMTPANITEGNGCKICRGNKYYFLGKDGKYAVYCHTTPDGKKYIGMTNLPLKKRFSNGRGYAGKLFQEAIKEYGWNNIQHEVLDYGLTKEQASECEIKYINLYNTTNPECGYNVATGGIHGFIPHRVLSEETRAKIANAHKGMKMSDECRRKMSENHKGLDNHQKRCVLKVSKDGEILEEYESLKMAAKLNGLSGCNDIWRVCVGKRKTAGGFAWQYK